MDMYTGMCMDMRIGISVVKCTDICTDENLMWTGLCQLVPNPVRAILVIVDNAVELSAVNRDKQHLSQCTCV